MVSPTMRRIENQLCSKFPDIPLADCRLYKESQKETARNSRRLAALAVEMESGETNTKILVDSITDGIEDQGIDAIYLDDNHRELIVVQSKWRANGRGSISSDETAKFATTIERVLEMEFSNPNDRLKGKINEIEKALGEMGYTIHAIIISTTDTPINEECMYPIKKLQDKVNDVDTFLVFSEINIQNIYDYLARGKNNSIDLTINLRNWGYIKEPYKAYYGTVDAADVAGWYQQFGDNLFSQNIRFFKENTEVNQGIVETLAKEPENFFLYNNGIKLLCSETIRNSAFSSSRTITSIELKNASIVNGAQTTGSIAKYYQSNHNDEMKEAPVFIEVIDLTGMPESAASTISKLSNTQNRIEGKDFAALDPQQYRIFRELLLEKEQINYIYKTGAPIRDADWRSCTLDEAIPALACEQGDIKLVALAKRNIGAFTADINKPPYTTLFNKDTNSVVLYNSIQVMRYVDSKLNNEYAKKQGRERLIAVHGNRFLLHLVLNSVKCTLNKSDLELSSQILDSETICNLVDKFLPAYIKETQFALGELFPDAYPANVFKNASRCDELKQQIQKNNLLI